MFTQQRRRRHARCAGRCAGRRAAARAYACKPVEAKRAPAAHSFTPLPNKASPRLIGVDLDAAVSVAGHGGDGEALCGENGRRRVWRVRCSAAGSSFWACVRVSFNPAVPLRLLTYTRPHAPSMVATTPFSPSGPGWRSSWPHRAPGRAPGPRRAKPLGPWLFLVVC